MKEVWKWVPGYEGRYRVSTFGRVRSVKRAVLNRYGTFTIRSGIIRRPGTTKRGYRFVRLRDKEGADRHFFVHQLVLLAFVGPCPLGMECRHYPDRDPNNNRLDNLSYCTKKQNALDRIEHGTSKANRPQGDNHPNSRLTVEKVIRLRKMWKSGRYTAKALGEFFGVSTYAAHAAATYKNWRHVP